MAITNADRVHRAQCALDTFADKEGSEAYQDDQESLLTDLLADLMHWAEWKEIDFDRQRWGALVHFLEERTGGKNEDI